MLRRTLVIFPKLISSPRILKSNFCSSASLTRYVDSLFGNLNKVDWDEKDLIPIKRDFFDSNLQLDQDLVEKFRTENRISIVTSSNGVDKVPDPLMQLADCNFPDTILEKLKIQGIQQPMPIQAQGWPIALAGSDIIAIGETGSGKTLGYLLPAICHTMNQPKSNLR